MRTMGPFIPHPLFPVVAGICILWVITAVYLHNALCWEWFLDYIHRFGLLWGNVRSGRNIPVTHLSMNVFPTNTERSRQVATPNQTQTKTFSSCGGSIITPCTTTFCLVAAVRAKSAFVLTLPNHVGSSIAPLNIFGPAPVSSLPTVMIIRLAVMPTLNDSLYFSETKKLGPVRRI